MDKGWIYTLILAAWVLGPGLALAGGGDFDDMPQQQVMQKDITVEVVMPEDKGWFSAEVLAAVIAGTLGLAGAVVGVQGARQRPAAVARREAKAKAREK